MTVVHVADSKEAESHTLTLWLCHIMVVHSKREHGVWLGILALVWVAASGRLEHNFCLRKSADSQHIAPSYLQIIKNTTHKFVYLPYSGGFHPATWKCHQKTTKDCKPHQRDTIPIPKCRDGALPLCWPLLLCYFPYLVCILFSMPSLHLQLIFFILCMHLH